MEDPLDWVVSKCCLDQMEEGERRHQKLERERGFGVPVSIVELIVDTSCHFHVGFPGIYRYCH